MEITAILPSIVARLRALLPPPSRRYVPLVVDGVALGWLDDARAARLARFRDVFHTGDRVLSFNARLRTETARSEAIEQVARALQAEGALSAWRDERYAVAASFDAPAAFLLERAAARYFGVCTYAAHVNGFVRSAAATELWFARRSPTKAIDPGLLDNLVGGGIAAASGGDGDDRIGATVVREAWEEAGIARDVALRAQRVAHVTICREQPDGLQRETIFVHDLELPASFAPANQDGEAIEFRRIPLDDAARLLANTHGADVVTADASLVVVDFLLRRGAIAEDAPERAALASLVAVPLALR